ADLLASARNASAPLESSVPALPPPPQMSCATPHAGPRSDPAPAAVLLNPVRLASASARIRDRLRCLPPSAPETINVAAQMTAAAVRRAPSASSAAVPTLLPLTVSEPAPPARDRQTDR